jgi:hypothetical protein
LGCADVSALSFGETCLAERKRRRVTALHTLARGSPPPIPITIARSRSSPGRRRL